ncbi:MAG: TadE/TadG family type IV pilus assembly protein [Chloroflexota bacterium]
MAEIAIVLPVLLLVLLMAIDFGRLFSAVVTLNNAVRVGANYAATHPYAWDAINSPTDAEQRADYEVEILRELVGANCTLDPVTPSQPTFPGGTLTFGSTAQTALTCRFTPLTPMISLIVGQTVPLSAAAVFPIRTGVPGEAPPLPPCFNQSTVPQVEGEDINVANALIEAAGLVAAGSPTLTTGQRGVAKNQSPVGGTCASTGSTVTYEYRP